MNLRDTFKDKRVQIAAGAGAVLGLVTLIRKRGSNAAGAGDGQAAGVATTGGGGGYLGGYDSTATDVYANLQNSLDNQLGEFRNQIGGLQDQLDRLGTGGSTPKPGKPVTLPNPKPKNIGGTTSPVPPRKLGPGAKKTGGTVITIPRGATLGGIAQKYGTSVSRLMSLNPSIKNPNRISAGARLRVK